MPSKADELAKLTAAKGQGTKPKAAKKGPKLTEKVANEPVVFSATTGRIYVTDGKVDRYGVTLEDPLIVDFGEGHGEEAHLTGGLSRAFRPDAPDCGREGGSYCDCSGCLALVREYIAVDRYGVCADGHVREEDTNPPTKPYAGFDTAHVADIEQAVKLGAIDNLQNAVKWEKTHLNRQAILNKLDELAAAPEEPEDADILAAEVVV